MIRIKKPQQDDPLLNEAREYTKDFKREGGSAIINGKKYEYTVFEYLAGAMREYLATVRCEGRSESAKGPSFHAAYALAFKQYLK